MYFKGKMDTNIDNEFGKKKKLNIRNMKIKDYLILGGATLFIIIGIILITWSGRESYFIDLDGEDLIMIYKDSEYVDPGYSARNNKGVDFTDKVVDRKSTRLNSSH